MTTQKSNYGLIGIVITFVALVLCLPYLISDVNVRRTWQIVIIVIMSGVLVYGVYKKQSRGQKVNYLSLFANLALGLFLYLILRR